MLAVHRSRHLSFSDSWAHRLGVTLKFTALGMLSRWEAIGRVDWYSPADLVGQKEMCPGKSRNEGVGRRLNEETHNNFWDQSVVRARGQCPTTIVRL